MHYTIDSLMNNNLEIVNYYQIAKALWQQLYSKTGFAPAELIAEELRPLQMKFEQQCGGQHRGQEIMVVSGIARFYALSDGFGDDREHAECLLEAFELSMCSLEVKFAAKKIGKLYRLIE